MGTHNRFRSLRDLNALLINYRELIYEMAKREITDRYLGQVLGPFWAIGHPLVLICVYVFIFAIVFKVKIGGTLDMPLDYTTYLLSGLIPWLSFQDSINKGSMTITGNANLVKQVIFPVEILPVKSALASVITLVLYLLLLMLYVLISHKFLMWTYFLLPILIFFQTITMIGLTYIVSAIGAYLKDTKDFVQVFCLINMYLMPIFYLPSFVPQVFRPILYINPFSYYIWAYQDAIYFGRFQHWWAWPVMGITSIILFYLGYRLFRKLKILFGDLL